VVTGDLGGVGVFAWEGVEMACRNLCVINFSADETALMLALIKLCYMLVPLS